MEKELKYVKYFEQFESEFETNEAFGFSGWEKLCKEIVSGKVLAELETSFKEEDFNAAIDKKIETGVLSAGAMLKKTFLAEPLAVKFPLLKEKLTVYANKPVALGKEGEKWVLRPVKLAGAPIGGAHLGDAN